MLDLQSGVRGDFFFCRPGPDPGISGERGKGRKADDEEEEPDVHVDLEDGKRCFQLDPMRARGNMMRFDNTPGAQGKGLTGALG